MLHQLSDLGTNLAIDDFGSGYCGLSYLRRFQFSKLKIDRSFVQSVLADPRDALLTAVIITIGKLLHMKVVAEYVETKEQMEFLRSLACDEIQGYYFSQPLSASAFAERFQAQRASLPM
jgi:EAL domain-containing protein (putative c-di-GMP-specific phosphodiesterase class I)